VFTRRSSAATGTYCKAPYGPRFDGSFAAIASYCKITVRGRGASWGKYPDAEIYDCTFQ